MAASKPVYDALQALRKPFSDPTCVLANLAVRSHSRRSRSSAHDDEHSIIKFAQDISQSRHSSEQGSFSSTPLSGPAIDGLGPQVHDTPPMDKDTYRIHSSRGIYIWTTPLILPAVVLLLKDFGARVRDFFALEMKSHR